MIPLPAGLYAYAATAILAFALGGSAAWKVQAWRHAANEVARVEAEAELRRNNERAANVASGGLEDDKAKTEERNQIITRWRDKIIDRPVYRSVCVDPDGLRLLNGAIRRTGPAGEPGLAVPKPAGN